MPSLDPLKWLGMSGSFVGESVVSQVSCQESVASRECAGPLGPADLTLAVKVSSHERQSLFQGLSFPQMYPRVQSRVLIHDRLAVFFYE